ncbi:MAG: hypothetical protein P4L45_05470 [Ignavibacteriaceae bacterium]|nr:hypothetical protein [Ignavibacteriaceae bacterium]
MRRCLLTVGFTTPAKLYNKLFYGYIKLKTKSKEWVLIVPKAGLGPNRYRELAKLDFESNEFANLCVLCAPAREKFLAEAQSLKSIK